MHLLRLLVPLALSLFPLTLPAVPSFVGGAGCVDCHAQAAEAWRGSHHDLAMAEVSEQTVLGDFNDRRIEVNGITSRFYRQDGEYFVHTDGPDGALHDYPIAYTFGWYPLQQYLIAFPDGRLQSLGIAWDSRDREQGGQRWFSLYPGEAVDHRHPLHWTGREQTWNYQCAECHSTNLQKRYDLKSDTYRTTWSEIDVACEACHGPGSEHLAWASAAEGDPARSESSKGLTVDLSDRDAASWSIDAQTGKPRRSTPRREHKEIALCARCHSRRGALWSDYTYGAPLGDGYRLALLDENLYFPDGQIKDEVYVYGSFIQSRMYHAGVTCSDCHEPHSLKPRAEGDLLCVRCHQASAYDTGEHHHHPTDSAGAACIACHMPQRTYMGVDERADHSLRIPRPDLSEKLGTPNACTGCHADKPAAWAAEAVAGWFPDSPHRGPHFGERLHDRDTASRLALAADASQPAIARASALDGLDPGALGAARFTLQRLLGDSDPLLRAAAARYLASADIATRVDLLWPLLDDPVRSVRLEATRALAELIPQRLPEKFRRQLDTAIEEYLQSQSTNAERPESHMNIGLMAVAAGDYAKAELAYGTALRLDPAFVPGYVNLADLYRRQGRDEEGERLLRSGLARVGEEADLDYALGLSLVRQKRLEEALPALRAAAGLAVDRPRYAYVYALALQGAGKLPDAIEVLVDARRRAPDNPEILQALADLHRQQGDLEQAEQYARELEALRAR